jgi:hypothetical protein
VESGKWKVGRGKKKEERGKRKEEIEKWIVKLSSKP